MGYFCETLSIGKEKNYLRLEINGKIIFDGHFKTYINESNRKFKIVDLNGGEIECLASSRTN